MVKSKSECTPKEDLLIVGASSALGIAFIRDYGLEFRNIVAHCYENADELQLLAKDWPTERAQGFHIIKADLSAEEGAADLVKLVENTGLQIQRIAFFAAPRLQLKRFHKIDWQEFVTHINVQSKAAFFLLRALMPKMATAKNGKIVFVLSSVVDGKPPQGMSDYVFGKYAMLGLMKSAAAEYSAKHICINAVSPSMMETRFLDAIPGAVIEQNAESHPRGANAKPSEIIPLVRFLLSDEAGFVTGQNIVASGGA